MRTSGSAVHPSYAEVDQTRRWRGPVQTLWAHIHAEAGRRPGKWHWRMLPNGIIVAVTQLGRDREFVRYELRLSRQNVPGREDNDIAWQEDTGSVLRSLRIIATTGGEPSPMPFAHWLKLEEVEEPDRRAVRLTSLLWGEVRPFRAECWVCRQEDRETLLDWLPTGGVQGQRCTDHVEEIDDTAGVTYWIIRGVDSGGHHAFRARCKYVFGTSNLASKTALGVSGGSSEVAGMRGKPETGGASCSIYVPASSSGRVAVLVAKSFLTPV